ncbi:DUF2971 domain-containing protein [Flavobacterium subsaxonicum]|uniref:DUF2971 domain-containing protein n=1 Tax=Flavobacterium subsaxonicum WB 4.1-42 = DSM 21790 TaxID=1121898 RepID=A0A0A2MP86_9FLAO|nr:DUF2971 domain-containing protein [Flavobacterium subsaxonicum]KGO93263.1 hypothetical protein Q766_08125 [Flavobacterium subsaxonicum WB 4.1-42 = DSM 21790]
MNLPLPELVKLGILQKQIPQYFFKYRTLEQLEKILENNSLWFSNPQDFNDPFDCQIVVDGNNNEEEIKQLIRRTVPPAVSDLQVAQLAKEATTIPGRWGKIINDSITNIIARNGVCCFAGNESNLLLWSHYSNAHKGVCLRFDALKDPDFFVFPLPVNYQSEYPNYNHLGDRQDILKSLILTKSNHWKYEEEQRILKTNDVGLHQFKKPALVEITFGCRCTEEEIKKYIELTKTHGFSATFKKAVKKHREYGLDFIIID